MNNELCTKGFRFANVGRVPISVTEGLTDEKEKKEAVEKYMMDRKEAQTSRERWIFDSMLAQTATQFGDRLEQAEELAEKGLTIDWETEFVQFWLWYMLLAAWRCRIRARILMRRDRARYAALAEEWKDLRTRTPAFSVTENDRERLQAQARWRRNEYAQMRKEGKAAYWSQVSDPRDPWWIGDRM